MLNGYLNYTRKIQPGILLLNSSIGGFIININVNKAGWFEFIVNPTNQPALYSRISHELFSIISSASSLASSSISSDLTLYIIWYPTSSKSISMNTVSEFLPSIPRSRN